MVIAHAFRLLHVQAKYILGNAEMQARCPAWEECGESGVRLGSTMLGPFHHDSDLLLPELLDIYS